MFLKLTKFEYSETKNTLVLKKLNAGFALDLFDDDVDDTDDEIVNEMSKSFGWVVQWYFSVEHFLSSTILELNKSLNL